MKGPATQPHPHDITRDLVQDNTRHLRNLSHELSNALDTVLQASYLLEQSKLSPSTRNWVKMISNAAQDAAAHNREIREVLRRLLPAPESDVAENEKPNLQLVKNRKTRPTTPTTTSPTKSASASRKSTTGQKN